MAERCTPTTPETARVPPTSRCSGTTERRTSASRRSPSSRRRQSSASAGCRMTAPATAGRVVHPAGTWLQPPPTSRPSPTRWASTGSRWWVIPGAVRMPWRARRSCPSASSASSASPRSPPTQPGTRLVRRHGRVGRRVPARRRRRSYGKGTLRSNGRGIRSGILSGRSRHSRRGVVLACRRRQGRDGDRTRRADRRRPGVCSALGIRPGARPRAGPSRPRQRRSSGAQHAQPLARQPLSIGRVVARAGRRAHLGSQLGRGSSGLAPRTRRRRLRQPPSRPAHRFEASAKPAEHTLMGQVGLSPAVARASEVLRDACAGWPARRRRCLGGPPGGRTGESNAARPAAAPEARRARARRRGARASAPGRTLDRLLPSSHPGSRAGRIIGVL